MHISNTTEKYKTQLQLPPLSAGYIKNVSIRHFRSVGANDLTYMYAVQVFCKMLI